jgi:hypothetical protein
MATKTDVKTDLLMLAERCERATGPSRHLDMQIFIVLDPNAQHIVGQKPGPFPQKAIYGPRSSFWDWAMDEDKELPQFAPILAYTASLDAALTLVPEGRRRIEFGTYEGGRAWAYVHTNADIIGETDDAPTEAVAICAAALRARAQEQHP